MKGQVEQVNLIKKCDVVQTKQQQRSESNKE